MEREMCKKKGYFDGRFFSEMPTSINATFSGCCLKNQSQMVMMRKRKAIKGTL